MKILTLLNIVLIIDAVVVLTLVLITVFGSASDYTKLIVPVTSLISLSLIRTMQVNKQKTLSQLQAVRINKQ
ncbi:hypothetical protein [Mucilaginibacter sp. dw_454]|uniref:hypothetical protein n=1 Tax=Mucilaginibacter sp. dw_454 TaxID=2720079 RepID=UPI001BD431DF|nr:hypothetical protein [Mucilaginibacter sp. dw_454]